MICHLLNWFESWVFTDWLNTNHCLLLRPWLIWFELKFTFDSNHILMNRHKLNWFESNITLDSNHEADFVKTLFSSLLESRNSEQSAVFCIGKLFQRSILWQINIILYISWWGMINPYLITCLKLIELLYLHVNVMMFLVLISRIDVKIISWWYELLDAWSLISSHAWLIPSVVL